MSIFSETMRRLRYERHMTQEEFADLLGTTKQNISRYESGAVSPKITTAAIIAEKLGISLSELSGEDITRQTGEENGPQPPKTIEARNVSGWLDSQPEALRKYLESMVLAMILNSPDHVAIPDMHKK